MSPQARRVPVTEPSPWDGAHDYADAFEIRSAQPDPRTAEQLAREAIDTSPLAIRAVVLIAHRHVLRFDLGPATSADHVLGWRITDAQPDVLTLQATSATLRGTIVARRAEPRLSVLTTFLQYRSAAARPIWAALGPVHRAVAPYLLEHAVRSTSQSQ